MNLRTWTDIAIIFLAVEAFIITLVPLVAVFFLVRGMNIVGGAMPGYMKQAQSFTRTVRLRTGQTTDQIAKPILRLRNNGARIESTIRSLSSEAGATIYGDQSAVQSSETPKNDMMNDQESIN